MLVDPCSDYCYVAVSDNSPIKILKIDLRDNNKVIKTVDTAKEVTEGNYEVRGPVDMIYIEKGNPSHKIFIKQKLFNKDTSKFTRLFMTFQCNSLELVNNTLMDGQETNQYIISEFIEKRDKLFIAKTDTYALNMLDFGDVNKLNSKSKLVVKNIAKLN